MTEAVVMGWGCSGEQKLAPDFVFFRSRPSGAETAAGTRCFHTSVSAIWKVWDTPCIGNDPTEREHEYSPCLRLCPRPDYRHFVDRRFGVLVQTQGQERVG